MKRRAGTLLAVCCVALATVPPAHADDCSGPSDCGTAPSNVDAAVALGAAGVLGGLGYWAWRRRAAVGPCADLHSDAAIAAARARRLRREADEAKKRADAARARRETDERATRVRELRERLARLDANEKSWMEGAGGRLQGVRLTSDDLRRIHAEEQAVRDRYARGEIGVEERERLLAQWGDEDWVRSHASKWAEERAAERRRIEEELAAAEREAQPARASDDADRAAEDARIAEQRAVEAEARAKRAKQVALECDHANAVSAKREKQRRSGVAAGAAAAERP